MAATVQTPTIAHANPISQVKQDVRTVTVLLATFAGLGLPRTLSLPVHAATPVRDVVQLIDSRLPDVGHSLIITTTNNKQLLSTSEIPVSSLLGDASDTFLPLRLSARLCGGKGGFGSQLRAAGGRMSSRKKRDQNQNQNGSSRNLDGRRLRTVDEAKRLGELLAKKEEYTKNASSDRVNGLQDNIKKLEAQIDLLQSGKLGGDKGRLDAEYVESKEREEEKTREALRRSLMAGQLNLQPLGQDSEVRAGSNGADMHDSGEDAESASSSSGGSKAAAVQSAGAAAGFWGFDDEDSDEDDEEEDPDTSPEPATTSHSKD